eukprot:863351-Pyramimonas_sp.AAC.1
MNSVRHDAHAHAPRDYGSRDKPDPGQPRAELSRLRLHRTPGLEPSVLPPPASGRAGKNGP